MKKLIILLALTIGVNGFAENGLFVTTVTTATTAVQLSTTVGSVSTLICEPTVGNTGTYMYWGVADVSPTNSIRLEKDVDPISLSTSPSSSVRNEHDTSAIWIESDTDGDKMTCYWTKSK